MLDILANKPQHTLWYGKNMHWHQHHQSFQYIILHFLGRFNIFNSCVTVSNRIINFHVDVRFNPITIGYIKYVEGGRGGAGWVQRDILIEWSNKSI